MAIPAEIVQGATYSWQYDEAAVDLAGVSTPLLSASYTLTVILRGNLDTLTLTGAAATNARDWTLAITATQSSALHSGAYLWQAFASASGARYAIANGALEVLPDLASIQHPPIDMRSESRKKLDNFNAMLADAARLKTLDPSAIEVLDKARYWAEQQVKSEKDKALRQSGGYPTNKMQVRFV